jgi:S-adenosylmethionine:tRNA ribosyltransferase-isomerase
VTLKRSNSYIDEILEPYNYSYPKELVALVPASPRDVSKLLIYNREKKAVYEDVFRNIANYIEPGSLIVINETKVDPVRIILNKNTGGKVQLLITRIKGEVITAISDRELSKGMSLYDKGKRVFTVVSQDRNKYILKLVLGNSVQDVINRIGNVPLPPYLKRSPLKESDKRRKYQSIFAKYSGSSAAPTASLHFTERVFRRLKKKNITIARVTLHVGLGTFSPVNEDNLRQERLHTEPYEIQKSEWLKIKKAHKDNRNIIAVGTTALRALESAALTNRLKGDTSLFIREGYQFKIVTGLITNFHVPRSSLLMLVSAFAGRDATKRLYRKAISEKYRLFSFGDAMYIS